MPVNIGYLGEGILAAVFLLCSFAAVLGLAALKLQIATARKILLWAKRAQLAAAGLSVLAFILLVAAFLTDDFSIAAVGRHSSAKLPFFYKLSAAWAGSAGSLLLWSVCLLLLFALWLFKAKTENLGFRFDAIALSIGSGVCLGFTALLVFIARPFALCPVTIDDGAGLNPLLQNFWMITHPPLLFIGYSAFLIPFVIVIAGVFSGKAQEPDIYRQLRNWLLFGICFLGLGIATGARWSYLELGWGGYWAWDPVENASLLPWLLAVAALHTLAGIHLSDRFKLWTVVLTPVPFILCLFATFITRSGILQSVHSFGHNVMFSALLVFIGCCFLLWLLCIIRAAKTITIVDVAVKVAFGLDKTRILFWANVIFVVTAVIIGTATFWPVIQRLVTASHSGFVLTAAFYDRVISVAGILLAFLVGLFVLADSRKRHSRVKLALSCCGVGLLCFFLLLRFTAAALLTDLACGICGFSFVAVFTKLASNLKTRRKIAGQIAHLGLLLLVAAVGFTLNEQAIQMVLAKGQKIPLGKYELVYDSFKHKSFANVTGAGPEIVVKKDGSVKKLWPHNSLYPDGRETSEVTVYTGLFEDIYISFDGVDRDGRVVITAKLKPMMLWLWFAVLLIAAGSAWAMFENKKKA